MIGNYQMRNLIREIKEWIKRKLVQFKNSRFLLFVIAFIIGATMTYNWIEGRKLYEYINGGLQILEVRADYSVDKEPLAQAGDLPTESATGSSAPSATSPASLADYIYLKESSSGKNDQKCERIGGHNGYGFGQGVGRNFCLGSDDEMREVVIKWIEEKQMTDKEKLCLYNIGIITSDCPYAQGFNN